jgi:lysophospholipase L1-like esterase
MACAASNGIATLDTFPRLAAEPRPNDLYGTVHMNARGNRMIASLLAATLRPLLTETTGR